MTRREVILAYLARASSACMQQALLLLSVSSSNLGFAVFVFFMHVHLLKKNLNAFKPSEHPPDQKEKLSKHLGENVGVKEEKLFMATSYI